MRIFALSDIHVDYEVNTQWVASLSHDDYVDDVLILAGDVSDSMARLEWCLGQFAMRFKKVLFIPGNHDVWVIRGGPYVDSLDKFHRVCEVAGQSGVSMAPYHHRDVSIVPLLGWYDFSFGLPDADLQRSWMDFRACRWPGSWTVGDVTSHFLQMNGYRRRDDTETIISFSHFMPRIDLMPQSVSEQTRRLFPVLGSERLQLQVQQLRSVIHVYGHSHLNRREQRGGTLYVNNAYGYPSETRIAAKTLYCVHEIS
ncbi:metallophosphoesterase [uncultured Bradyrhizobium sp.]|uniref:metallophosphoesterase family protein n=1 Tax=uncultured Bradyrhizobium sp. TaxID=199684 RepID=UPI0035CA5107